MKIDWEELLQDHTFIRAAMFQCFVFCEDITEATKNLEPFGLSKDDVVSFFNSIINHGMEGRKTWLVPQTIKKSTQARSQQCDFEGFHNFYGFLNQIDSARVVQSLEMHEGNDTKYMELRQGDDVRRVTFPKTRNMYNLMAHILKMSTVQQLIVSGETPGTLKYFEVFSECPNEVTIASGDLPVFAVEKLAKNFLHHRNLLMITITSETQLDYGSELQLKRKPGQFCYEGAAFQLDRSEKCITVLRRATRG